MPARSMPGIIGNLRTTGELPGNRETILVIHRGMRRPRRVTSPSIRSASVSSVTATLCRVPSLVASNARNLSAMLTSYAQAAVGLGRLISPPLLFQHAPRDVLEPSLQF